MPRCEPCEGHLGPMVQASVSLMQSISNFGRSGGRTAKAALSYPLTLIWKDLTATASKAGSIEESPSSELVAFRSESLLCGVAGTPLPLLGPFSITGQNSPGPLAWSAA